ncbi:MAG: hypothetical protein AAGF29_04640 [Pseudomonadota bacterium]
MRLLRLAAIAIVLPLIATGCQKTSPYAKSSKFASVYTAGYGGSSLGRPAPVFPYGLQRPALSEGKTHFIEFRARNAISYGHAAVAFGKLDRDGGVPRLKNGDLKPGQIEISGLAPASDSEAVYRAGHVVPVYATTGPSDGDDEKAYLLASYRINLTKDEFDRLVKIMKRRKAGTHYWNGPLNSCVTYLRRIAEDMGLITPVTRHLPEGFVRKLKRINEPRRATS